MSDADGRLRRHLSAVEAYSPPVAQTGDWVVVTDGPFEGQTGQVVSIHLVVDGGIRRVAAVLLNPTGGAGVRLRYFTKELRVLEFDPADPASIEGAPD